MVSHDERSAHFAGELAGVTREERRSTHFTNADVGDGHGRKNGAFGLRVHALLP
jgi:hypothetical protein